MSNQKGGRGGLLQENLSRGRLFDQSDKLALLLPIITATSLHFLIRGTDTTLALNYQNPAFYQFYTAAYVHATTDHLVNNIFGYALSVPPLYALYTHQDRRRQFFAAFAVIVLAVPVVANVASYLTWGVYLDLSIQYGRGLSGVVAAFVGLLLMNVLRAYDEELREENTNYAASMLGIILFATWSVMFTGLIRVLMLAMLGVVVVLVVYLSWRGDFAMAGLDDWGRENPRYAAILIVSTFAALLLIVVSFPADLQNKGGFTNLVGHAAGFFSGMVIHYWLLPPRFE